ncbi:putative deoxyribonuclease TATDN2 isoform X2 [Lepeophtheirus salmonis]|uniref:putative deoxyribonuclease TATDN2 isoform X2 n=1 Tax=Lepeophtheirus salmonis TaxID=72036 RepID=UPI001AE1A5BE|nr:putative deoxyribonuclease TATDN2 isoform X2 [Lepeophtheirus salmonis]
MSFWPQNAEIFHAPDDESSDLTKAFSHTSLNGNSMTLIENSPKILHSIVKISGSHDNESNPCKKAVVISNKQHFLLERKRSRIDPGILYDSHCHYDFLLDKLNLRSYKEYCYKYPKGDFGREYMGGIINNFCDPSSWGDYNGSIPLFDELMKDPRIYFTFGCHPRFASAFNDSHLAKLEKLIQTKRVVALGEIGLDFADVYGKSTSPHDVQIAVFYEQLLLAKKYNKPIVLHIRDAEQETIEVLKRANIPSNYNIHRHSMINSWEVTKKWLEEFPESMIGITNIVTKPEMKQVHELVQQLPLDRIVLETDAPYFYPYHVVKWKSTHHVSYPMLVIHVAEKIVELRKNESLNEFILAVKKNVEKVYRLSEHEEPIGVNQIEFKSVGCQTMYPEEYVFSYFHSSDEESDLNDEEDDI